jgi:hypothetical protein
MPSARVTGRMSWQFATAAQGCGALRTTGRKAICKERSHG